MCAGVCLGWVLMCVGGGDFLMYTCLQVCVCAQKSACAGVHELGVWWAGMC